MTFQPNLQQAIYERIRDAITSASNITNFSTNSPERAITDDGFAAEMVERQHELLYIQLSNRIDYAGKTITEDDLNALELNSDVVDLELLNSFVTDEDLDEYVKRNSVIRDPGSFATGQVTFTVTGSSVTVPAGTEVSTELDSEGNAEVFSTDNDVSPSSGTTITADITANERGSNGNVGSGTITRLPSPPPGVSSVTNNNPTTGGEDEETNEELRERAKNAITRRAGGGTVSGVEGSIVSEFDGLDDEDVKVIEYPNASPQVFDVVVNGGPSDSDLNDKIDEEQPVAVEGTLVRPTDVNVSITADLSGTASDIDTDFTQSQVDSFIAELGIGEDLITDQLIATIMNSDSDIVGINTLTLKIIDEVHTYQTGTDIYELDKQPIVTDSVENVEDDSGDSYVNGTDYDEADDIGGGEQDSIDWSIGGSNPSDTEDFFVDYEVDHDIGIADSENAVAESVTITVS